MFEIEKRLLINCGHFPSDKASDILEKSWCLEWLAVCHCIRSVCACYNQNFMLLSLLEFIGGSLVEKVPARALGFESHWQHLDLGCYPFLLGYW